MLLAVTPGGVYRTINAGLNWSQVSMPYTQSDWNTVFWDRAAPFEVVISGPDMGVLYATDPRAAISADGGASFHGLDLPLNADPEGDPQTAQAVPGDVWGFNGVWYIMGNSIHNVQLGWPCHRRAFWRRTGPGQPWEFMCTWPAENWDVWRYISGLWSDTTHIYGLFDHMVGNPIIDSINSGLSWTKSSQILDTYKGILADPVRANRLWVLAKNSLYYSDSGLNGFVGVSGLSMPSGTRAVAVDGYKGVVYTGSGNRGFAYSETGEASWTRADIPLGGPVTTSTALDVLAAEQPAILDPPDRSTMNDCSSKNGDGDPRECQLSSAGQTQGYAGDPVNTRTGNLSYGLVDLEVQTMSMPLTFQRSYSSQAVAIEDGPLGSRWTHNHDTRLIFPDDPGGEPEEVWFKAHSANQYRFFIGYSGEFVPDVGVQAELVEEPGPPVQYRLTTASQSEYLFDEDGVLIEWADPQGRVFTYTYDLSGKLERVTAPDGVRYLELTYDPDDRISSVADHSGRSVSYAYDTNGDLTGFTDVMGEFWSYTYDGNHQLTHIVDPRGVTTLRTEYEASPPTVVDFNAVTVSSYGSGQDNDPTHTIEDSGATLHLGGNAWKVIDFPYTVTIGTRLAFDFKSPVEGEIHAIGVDDDNDWYERPAFQLYGTDSSDMFQEYNNYAGNEPDWVHYNIPLGAFVTGDIEYLVFINDHDVTTPTAESYFSNIELYETYTRVARQYNGENELLVELSYGPGGTTTITDGLGNITTHQYDEQGILYEQIDALGGVKTRGLSPNYRPSSVMDPAGDVLEMDWTPDGANLQSIADPEGGQTDFTYDTLNNITEVVDPRGYLTTFTYDGTRVTSSTDPLSNTTTFTYTTPADAPQPEGLLKTITDPLGRVTSFTYDSLGQRTTMTDAAGSSWSFDYDVLGRLEQITDPLGHVQWVEYDAAGHLLRVIQNYDLGYSQNAQNVYNITTEFDYDQVGNLLSVTDSLGRVTTYAFDDADRLVQEANPAGHMTGYAYDLASNLTTITDPLGRVTQFHHDALNRLDEIEDPLGGVTARDYNTDGTLASSTDPLGRVTTFTYDDAKRLVSVLDPLGGTSLLNYDLAGNLLTSTNALGHTTAYAYDPLNRPDQVTDALGGVTQYVYDAVGNRIQGQDANGHITIFEYDALNRLVSQTDPNGNLTSWAYDEIGNLSQATNGLGNSTTFSYDALNRLSLTIDALGNTTHFAYDPLGTLTTLTDANGVITHYEYDVLDRLVGVVENSDPINPPDSQTNVPTGYTYDAVGNLLSILDANGHLRSYSYDDLDRRVAEIDALGHTASFTYDAMSHLILHTDALGFTTQYGYDAGDRLTSIDYPSPDADVTFDYDLLGNLTEMVDGVGTTTWALDALSRPLTVNDPFGGQVAYTYDAIGNRLSLEYPSGKQVSYDYDPGDRLVEVEDWDSGATVYTYDAANRLTAASLPNGVLSSYGYDALGQVTSIEHALGAQTLASFEYSYDAVGNRVQAIEGVQDPLYEMFLPLVSNGATAVPALHSEEPLEPTTTPTFTSTPTPSSTITPLVTPTATLTSLPTGTATLEPTAEETATATSTLTSTATATPTLTSTGTLTSTAASTRTPEGVSGLTAGRGNLAALVAYQPNSIDAKPAASVGWNLRTINYTYDALYRLTAADYSSGEFFHYAYDAVGNRLSQTMQAGTENYTYDAADRLTSLDGTPFIWDDNGSLLSDGEWTYAYDHADRLTTISGTSGTFNYAYSGLGDRLQGPDGENPVDFTLDLHAGLTQVLEQGSESYLYGIGRIGAEASGEQAYFLSDALGSVRGVSGEDGEMDLARGYTPFGETLSQAGWGESDYGYAGEWGDPAGLLYLRARYYMPDNGIFTQSDPWHGDLTRPQTLPGYAYAKNNPVTLSDPGGQCYGDFDFLRGVEGQNCQNLDMALIIMRSESATPLQKQMAGAYVGAWGIAHTYLAAGAVGLAVANPTFPLIGSGVGGGTAWAQQTMAESGICGCVAQEQAYEGNRGKAARQGIIQGFLGGAIFGGVSSLGAVGQTVSGAAGGSLSAYGMYAAGRNAIQNGINPCNALGFGLSAIGLGLSTYQFRRGLTNLSASPSNVGGLSPIERGKIGIELSKEYVENMGWRIVGEEVTIDTSAVRVRVDLVALTDNDVLVLIESKYGPTARLTPNQKVGYPLIRSTGGIPQGANAAAADLLPGQPLPRTDVIELWWNR